jgi:hypothetical protein
VLEQSWEASPSFHTPVILGCASFYFFSLTIPVCALLYLYYSVLFYSLLAAGAYRLRYGLSTEIKEREGVGSLSLSTKYTSTRVWLQLTWMWCTLPFLVSKWCQHNLRSFAGFTPVDEKSSSLCTTTTRLQCTPVCQKIAGATPLLFGCISVNGRSKLEMHEKNLIIAL